MKSFILNLTLFAFFAVISSCSPTESKVKSPASTLKDPSHKNEPHQKRRLKLMTYNVENLFDTVDDLNKNDESYLPLSKKKNKKIQKKCKSISHKRWRDECLFQNWTDFKLKEKIRRLAAVIDSYQADILFLQEVENLSVLKRLNQYLKNPYPTLALKEGPDKRGIDTAILSRLEKAGSAKLYLQSFKANKNFKRSKIKATRGILMQPLKLPDGQILKAYSVHLPSQGSPSEARKQALKLLLDKTKGENAVVGGDFNITKKEEKRFHFFSKMLGSSFFVSHLEGCSNCKGTQYYHPKRSWSFFDALLVSKNFAPGWTLDPKSIKVYNELDVQSTKFSTPARFNLGKRRTGVSDHYPMVSEIYLSKTL